MKECAVEPRAQVSRRKRVGDRTESLGTPLMKGKEREVEPSAVTAME